MTAKEMWAAYIQAYPCYRAATYEAWRYGSDTPDLLAALTLSGQKTATASAYPFSFMSMKSVRCPKWGSTISF